MTAKLDGSGRDTAMLTALVQLRGALQHAELPLELEQVGAHRTMRQGLIDQLEDYIIPRVMTMDGPLVAVVGGSTGAGKSTLVNTLVGERVTTPGLLRPTTRSAVLVHHPDDTGWFGQERLLPDLRRVEHATDDPTVLQLVASDRVPRGVALVDAPDVDSVEEHNRVLAGQLLAAADMWLFVTSAARYSDQVPWQYLREAADRSTAVAVILDRTPDEAVETVTAHLARMLAARGLKDSPIFVVPEGPVSDEGLLDATHVRDVRGWLEMLSGDDQGRSAVVKQTVDGAIRAMSHHTYPLVEATRGQIDALARLRAAVEDVFAFERETSLAAITDGTLLRGDVLARWQEFVGTGELLRSLDNKVGWLRDRVVNAVKGKPQQAERVTVAVEAGVELLVLEGAERAAGNVVDAWEKLPGGSGLVATGGPELGRASRDLRRRAEESVRNWQEQVAEMIRAESAGKAASARYLAFGVSGLSVALMIVVLAGRDGDPRSSADLGRKLLDAVFGAERVQSMVETATSSLTDAVAAALEPEQHRFAAVVDQLEVAEKAADQLREAARRVDDARFAQAR